MFAPWMVPYINVLIFIAYAFVAILVVLFFVVNIVLIYRGQWTLSNPKVANLFAIGLVVGGGFFLERCQKSIEAGKREVVRHHEARIIYDEREREQEERRQRQYLEAFQAAQAKVSWAEPLDYSFPDEQEAKGPFWTFDLGTQGPLHVFDIGSGKVTRVLWRDKRVECATSLKDGAAWQVLTVQRHNPDLVRVWDLVSNKILRTLDLPEAHCVELLGARREFAAVQFKYSDEKNAFKGNHFEVRIIDLRSDEVIYSREFLGVQIRSWDISPDRETLVFTTGSEGKSDSELFVWTTKATKMKAVPLKARQPYLRFSSDGQGLLGQNTPLAGSEGVLVSLTDWSVRKLQLQSLLALDYVSSSQVSHWIAMDELRTWGEEGEGWTEAVPLQPSFGGPLRGELRHLRYFDKLSMLVAVNHQAGEEPGFKITQVPINLSPQLGLGAGSNSFFVPTPKQIEQVQVSPTATELILRTSDQSFLLNLTNKKATLLAWARQDISEPAFTRNHEWTEEECQLQPWQCYNQVSNYDDRESKESVRRAAFLMRTAALMAPVRPVWRW